MSKSAERFLPTAFAVLLFLGVTTGKVPTPFLIAAAIILPIVAILFILHSMKKEASHE